MFDWEELNDTMFCPCRYENTKLGHTEGRDLTTV